MISTWLPREGIFSDFGMNMFRVSLPLMLPPQGWKRGPATWWVGWGNRAFPVQALSFFTSAYLPVSLPSAALAVEVLWFSCRQSGVTQCEVLGNLLKAYRWAMLFSPVKKLTCWSESDALPGSKFRLWGRCSLGPLQSGQRYLELLHRWAWWVNEWISANRLTWCQVTWQIPISADSH